VFSWGASSLSGLLIAVGGVMVMMVLLRWAFSSGHSVVAARPKSGTPDEYGLLVPVASPGTYVEGEQLRLRLAAANVTATLVSTTDGPRLMVFPQDASVARALLAQPRPEA
jgi:FtsP/CotA-like multicopper oxidase with cupredoxin domain